MARRSRGRDAAARPRGDSVGHPVGFAIILEIDRRRHLDGPHSRAMTIWNDLTAIEDRNCGQSYQPGAFTAFWYQSIACPIQSREWVRARNSSTFLREAGVSRLCSRGGMSPF